MESHPLYERPEEDQGREERTADWNKKDIMRFLNDQYSDPLEKYDVNSYEELGGKIDDLELAHGEESDWRHEQVSNLGEKNYDWGITTGLIRLEEGEERSPKPDDYVPWEVRFEDEKGEVQIDYDNR